ncbi:integral membrane protein [Fructobacillus pseudoficulneus]|uniref:Integral membrane protein n=1 Tax=Fructobacillus pseudoficulneus TaxID=220714 RepID=A0A3F3H2N8_9LACO|nr:YibE/F family protein [Fructobacillus pseudoficulneus]GAP02430.1 integral membrane protein [Fructobacillus pseudoficulneus]SEH36844.1 YibE/F-like protein [Fructobacillus pseudoficulneus]
MNAIGLLIILLLLSLLVVAGKQGLKTFLGLILNFALIFVLIILVNWGFNPYLVTAVISLLILSVAIYLSAGRARVMAIAWQTSVVVIILVGLLACFTQYFAQVQGYTLENSDELEGLSLNIGLNFSHLVIIVMIISALGAVAEASMAITADLFEVIERSPNITVESLSDHAQTIGGQILGTAINTLFFGMLGANIPLLIWYLRLHYTLAEFINAKLLVMEVATMLLGMIGILLSIWFSTFLVERGYQREGRKLLHESDV